MFDRPLFALVLCAALNITVPILAYDEESPSRAIAPTEGKLDAFALAPSSAELRSVADSSVSFRLAGFSMLAASAMDVVTTEWGLSQGLQEGNPIVMQRGVRIATHIACPLAVYWATERLNRAGRTKLAGALRISLMAAYSLAAVHNTQLTGASGNTP